MSSIQNMLDKSRRKGHFTSISRDSELHSWIPREFHKWADKLAGEANSQLVGGRLLTFQWDDGEKPKWIEGQWDGSRTEDGQGVFGCCSSGQKISERARSLRTRSAGAHGRRRCHGEAEKLPAPLDLGRSTEPTLAPPKMFEGLFTE